MRHVTLISFSITAIPPFVSLGAERCFKDASFTSVFNTSQSFCNHMQSTENDFKPGTLMLPHSYSEDFYLKITIFSNQFWISGLPKTWVRLYIGMFCFFPLAAFSTFSFFRKFRRTLFCCEAQKMFNDFLLLWGKEIMTEFSFL